MNEYFVPFSNGEEILIEKKSKFIARIIPVLTEPQAKKELEKIRKQEKGAVHNCYAYIIKSENIERFSDDGEPQGTAGKPILEVIQKEGVTNVLCVVTRYFGGTLLGTGGLVRAYNQSAKSALVNAGIAKMLPFLQIKLVVEYNFYDILIKNLGNYTIFLNDTEYLDKITVSLDILNEEVCDFEIKLSEISNGAVSPQKFDIIFKPYKI